MAGGGGMQRPARRRDVPTVMMQGVVETGYSGGEEAQSGGRRSRAAHGGRIFFIFEFVNILPVGKPLVMRMPITAI